MTQLLIRAFVKDYKNRQDPQVRERYGRMAGIVGVCCNLLLFAGKLMVGTLFGSIAITADAIKQPVRCILQYRQPDRLQAGRQGPPMPSTPTATPGMSMWRAWR